MGIIVFGMNYDIHIILVRLMLRVLTRLPCQKQVSKQKFSVYEHTSI
jgi:hypothetical protein